MKGIRGLPAATIGLASFRIGPKDLFFEILKPQTHVSLVKCTQPWSFNWSAGNFNWSAPPFQSVAIGPHRPIGPRAPTYGERSRPVHFILKSYRSKKLNVHFIHNWQLLGFEYVGINPILIVKVTFTLWYLWKKNGFLGTFEDNQKFKHQYSKNNNKSDGM